MLIDVPPSVARYLGYSSIEIKERLALTVSSVTLPAKSFFTHEMDISTPTRLIPYGINSNNTSGISFEFNVLTDMFEKNLFEKWQNLIVDPKTKQVGFYDDYAKSCSIYIMQLPSFVQSLDQAIEFLGQDLGANSIKLTEVYPYSVVLNNGSLNYTQSIEPLKMKVDFMYREVLRGGESPAKDIGIPVIDSQGRFTRTLKDPSEIPFVNSNENFVRNGLVNVTAEDAIRDWEQIQRRETQSMLEKIEERKKYDQRSNVPKGVDGRLIKPKVDGLPGQNPNDEIRNIFNQALTFISQGQGFLGQL
jgi:hypothetical protein